MTSSSCLATAAFAVGVFAIFSGGAAAAGTIPISFPAAGDAYFSATNGGAGTIPSGGQTAYMWTAGDYVTQTDNLGVSSITGFTDTFSIENDLSGDNETVEASINGINIGSFTALDCGACDSDQSVTIDETFAPIAGIGGSYTFTFTLEDTLPDGGGSIAFFGDGAGSVTTGVPEPAIWALMLAGFAGLGVALRRRRRLLATA
ncbi:MAG: PEPxxWA-CTERM sorting domain-containing protein [Caulobacteraceae bacterium]